MWSKALFLVGREVRTQKELVLMEAGLEEQLCCVSKHSSVGAVYFLDK